MAIESHLAKRSAEKEKIDKTAESRWRCTKYSMALLQSPPVQKDIEKRVFWS